MCRGLPFGSGTTRDVRAQRTKQTKRAFSTLIAELNALRRDLGPAGIRTIDQYTQEVRDIERRIQLAANASSNVPEFEMPPSVPEQFDKHMRLHWPLAKLL